MPKVSLDGTSDFEIPQHVAIIMDGNGRWAAARGLPRGEGHRRGVEALRRTDPAQALRWRLALRAVLSAAMTDEAWRVTGFARSGWYVLDGKGPG